MMIIGCDPRRRPQDRTFKACAITVNVWLLGDRWRTLDQADNRTDPAKPAGQRLPSASIFAEQIQSSSQREMRDARAPAFWHTYCKVSDVERNA
jgi:hypothetical protein